MESENDVSSRVQQKHDTFEAIADQANQEATKIKVTGQTGARADGYTKPEVPADSQKHHLQTASDKQSVGGPTKKLR